jgi:hypothetical protein
VSRPIHEVKPLQARLVRSWETRLEVRVLSVHMTFVGFGFSSFGAVGSALVS